MGKYKTYSKEFKLEAVRLLEKSGKPGAELAPSCWVKAFAGCCGFIVHHAAACPYSLR
jgi:hypothetical protein